MSEYPFLPISVIILFLASAITTGCMSTTVGDLQYTDNSLRVNIVQDKKPADIFLQLSIFRTAGLSQQEYNVTFDQVRLEPGNNSLVIPARLEPGTYKIYIYIIEEGKRKTAVIRDIEV
jgi:hypothetical protein